MTPRHVLAYQTSTLCRCRVVDIGTRVLIPQAYNEYSAAAIGATLIFFILPLFDITGFVGDFIFSALIGGGAAAYASLRKDSIGEYGNKFGGIVMQGIDKGVPAVKEKVDELVKTIKSSL